MKVKKLYMNPLDLDTRHRIHVEVSNVRYRIKVDMRRMYVNSILNHAVGQELQPEFDTTYRILVKTHTF